MIKIYCMEKLIKNLKKTSTAIVFSGTLDLLVMFLLPLLSHTLSLLPLSSFFVD